MTTELETRVQELLHTVDVAPPPVDPGAVLARGRRIRAVRRARRTCVAVIASAAVAAGVATATVPATGHPLTPLVWAAGPTPSGPAASTFMSVYGQRFKASIQATRVDHRRSWVMSELLNDGATSPIGSVTVEVTKNPATGLRSSVYPNVLWSLFPAGSTDIAPVFKDSVPNEVSTMKITSPFDGPDYVAVTVGVENAADLVQLGGFTWSDAAGRKHTYLPFDASPLTPIG